MTHPLITPCLKVAALALAIAAPVAQADYFNRIASFPTPKNLPAGTDINTETSPEIITVSTDGNTLIYSDSPLGGIGFVDIRDAKNPQPGGFVALDGEPTAVVVSAETVLAGVNTSENYTNPTGFLAAIDVNSQKIISRCDLGGQPDSVAVSKDGKFAAIAIENERNEDLNDGAIPQLPAGFVSIVNLDNGQPLCSTLKRVELTGLAEIGASDPEPEFVDFNANNEIAVTLQENNHIAIIDAETGKVLNHFPAGTVNLSDIDVKKDGALTFTSSLENVLREPDAIKWLDTERFVIANEGDYQGGARGFTIFNKNGQIEFEAGASFEHEVVKAGHFPDKRAGKKGVEPEGLAVDTFDGQTYIFVLAERAGVIGVYKDMGKNQAPEFVQLLPSGIAPESAVAIPARNLLVSANEKDLIEDGGTRAHVMLYEYGYEKPAYPQLVSKDLIGWGALSGLTANSQYPAQLFAVNDSYYKNQPSIFKIDATQTPAVITEAIRVTKGGKAAKGLDLEGIALDGKGGFWLASEGNKKKEVEHAIYHVNGEGQIDRTIAFPAELLKHQERFGAEGITQIGNSLWIAIQRPWKDDPADKVKLLSYNLGTKQWGAVHYPLEAPDSLSKQGWVGLSEITAYGDSVYIIERDNQIGEAAQIKRLYKVAMDELKPATLGGKLPVVTKTLAYDFLPDLKASNGYVTDKVEGFTIDAAGKGFAVTDNDGVDDSSGESFLFPVSLN